MERNGRRRRRRREQPSQTIRVRSKYHGKDGKQMLWRQLKFFGLSSRMWDQQPRPFSFVALASTGNGVHVQMHLALFTVNAYTQNPKNLVDCRCIILIKIK